MKKLGKKIGNTQTSVRAFGCSYLRCGLNWIGYLIRRG